jgi:hypothetical protein
LDSNPEVKEHIVKCTNKHKSRTKNFEVLSPKARCKNGNVNAYSNAKYAIAGNAAIIWMKGNDTGTAFLRIVRKYPILNILNKTSYHSL